MNLKPELTSAQKKWVEALRSGKYKQGTSRLSRDGYYCCLGVACEIFAKALGLKISLKDGRKIYDRSDTLAPIKIVKLLKLRSNAGKGKDFRTQTLTYLNDNGVSFNQIADLLETGEYFANRKTKKVD